MLRRGRKGIGAFVLAAAVMLGSVSVSAEPVGYKPQVSLETDRSEYGVNDTIIETVKIHNTTGSVMTDIRVEGNIPDGYQTRDGAKAPSQWSAEAEKTEAGADAEVEVTFIKDASGNTSGGVNPGQTSASGNKPGEKPGKASGKNVRTGDNTNVILWIMAGAASLSLIVMVMRRRRGGKLLSLLLVLAMGGTVLPGVSFISKAAGTETDVKSGQTVEASKKITVEGKEITLTAKVTYQAETAEGSTDLSYDGYELKWEDQFDAASLNREDWNVELHDPGWVNNELQAYVDSEENIYIQDGKLVLKPVEKKNEDGSVFYTSGRVNTQNKHDFKYGLFEARVKVPAGQGFLPAFWMMPTNENLYGQWPRCGEIDIMEVLGHATDTSYGTIHYGNPHSESQGNYTLSEGNFSDEYHVFDVEWEPGKISWYVDGKLIHTENDWYSATEGQGEISYPAPFDQPFYIILNLAVGGSWPGNPDETTDIAGSAYYIDYVKAYQKESYDENVKKPVKDVILRDPDENGNYIINGDFADSEDLTDGKDWTFLTALGGEGTAAIENKEIVVKTKNEGTVDYSVQLVQPDLPMKKGGVYRLAFDAYAGEARTMKVDVSAPDRSYRRYLADTTVELTTQKQTFAYEFTMTDSDDANGRLEFNMGAAGSDADIHISNVTLKKLKEIDLSEGEKGILADGNYVYNGSFQEGEGRLGYWDTAGNEGSEISVTNENNIRRLMVRAAEGTTNKNPVIISQSKLALTGGNTYALSFTAEGEAGKSIRVKAAGKTYEAGLTGSESKYNYKLELNEEPSDTDIAFYIEEPGVFYIDDVRIEEDSLIKNGSFNAGFAGYEPYVDGSADASYVVDSLTEDNAADFSINNTGDAAWKIQLKQNNIELEKEQWYRLSIDAKSDIARKLMFAIQRDGTNDDDWTPYSGEKIVDLETGYNTYVIEFQMTKETDPKAVLSISMGAIGGIQIKDKHRICIDNINLEKTAPPEQPEQPGQPEQPVGENMLKNGNFASGIEGWENAVTPPGEADASFENGCAVYNITNVGTEDWNVQLKQSGIRLEQGKAYRVSFKASSTAARTFKLAMLSPSYDWYGGQDISLEADQEKEITFDFIMEKATDANTTMVISMGKIADTETLASTIRLSDFSLVRVSENVTE